ncbi:MAG: hypothetical protein ACREB9_00210 [Thermoplasmata archaeon]
MPTIDVEDPATGRSIRLAVVTKGRRVFLKKVSEQSYDLSKTSPRRLESLAAFAEAATTAFGRKKTGDLPPATDPVRELVAKHMATIPRTPSAAQLKQQMYRALITPEEAKLLEQMRRQGIRGRVVRRPSPSPPALALSERPLPELRMLRPPPGY